MAPGFGVPHATPSVLDQFRRLIGVIPLPIFFPVGALIGILIALGVVGGTQPASIHRAPAAAVTHGRNVPIVHSARGLVVGRPSVVADKAHGKRAHVRRASDPAAL